MSWSSPSPSGWLLTISTEHSNDMSYLNPSSQDDAWFFLTVCSPLPTLRSALSTAMVSLISSLEGAIYTTLKSSVLYPRHPVSAWINLIFQKKVGLKSSLNDSQRAQQSRGWCGIQILRPHGSPNCQHASQEVGIGSHWSSPPQKSGQPFKDESNILPPPLPSYVFLGRQRLVSKQLEIIIFELVGN